MAYCTNLVLLPCQYYGYLESHSRRCKERGIGLKKLVPHRQYLRCFDACPIWVQPDGNVNPRGTGLKLSQLRRFYHWGEGLKAWKKLTCLKLDLGLHRWIKKAGEEPGRIHPRLNDLVWSESKSNEEKNLYLCVLWAKTLLMPGIKRIWSDLGMF